MHKARVRDLLPATPLVVCSCIVAEPPPYEPPQRTPPILDLVKAIPWVGTIYPLDSSRDPLPDEPTKLEFDIPFRSEDNGERLYYALHLDYAIGPNDGGQAFFTRLVEPSTYDDETRRIVFTSPVEASDGCHQLTLLMAHDSSWIFEEDRPDPLLGDGDTAMASWWINVNPAPGERFTLRSCPSFDTKPIIDR